MRQFIGAITTLCAMTFSASALLAEDYAILIAGDEITNSEQNEAVRLFEAANFVMIEARSRSVRDIMRALGPVEDAAEDGTLERVVIVVGGPFAHSSYDTWAVPESRVELSLMNAGGSGVSLSAISSLLEAASEGGALLVSPGEEGLSLGRGLMPNVGPYAQSDRVTYAQGGMSGLLDFAAEGLLSNSRSLAAAAETAPRDVRVTGYLPASRGFLGQIEVAAVSSEGAIEEGFWKAILAMETVEAYELYLGTYPRGAFASEAANRIDALRSEPARRAQGAEEALGLNRDARREVQRNLSLLGYNTRGIDGIFGPGTRGAITAWQSKERLDETGYLDSQQLERLAALAGERAAQLEAEARERRAQQEREDRAYWSQTGDGNDEAGLRAYLQRYPDGLFSSLALERLDAIESAARAQAAAAEQADWDAAKSVGSVQAYQLFLQAHPSGTYAEAAQTKISSLQYEQQNAAQIEQDKSWEQQIGSFGLSGILAEQRLAQLGFDPGAVDGNFDENTRRAIRQFQQAAGLTVTGYLGQSTVVRLLAG